MIARLHSFATSTDNPSTMPGTDSARKQHALGGAAGIVLLGFALVYRFFPGLLHVEPTEAPPVAATTAGAAHLPATPWSAVQAPPPAVVPAPAGEEAEASSGTSFADAVRMGPPVPATKAIAALLARARKAQENDTLLDPKEGAIALYRGVLAQAEGNVEAEVALERIGGALRDWALAAIDRGDANAAQRYVAAYAELPHSDKELANVRARLQTLQEILPMLAQAADLMRRGHLTDPPGGNALAIYREIMRREPGNHLADNGLAAIERGYLDRALAEAAQDNFANADRMLGQAAEIRPGSQAMLETRSRIDGIRRQSAETVFAQARSALDAGNPDLAEELARKAQAISSDLAGIDDFEQRVRNARLYASMKPGQVVRDRFLDIAGAAPPLVVLPTGSFVMGSPADEPGHLDSEEPQRRVDITIGFALGQSEVTVGQFREFVQAAHYATDAERLGGSAIYDEGSGRIVNRAGMSWQNDYRGERARDDLPVVNVSWNDATAYLAWLSARTGKSYRLPSEAEFEYALRAGSITRFPWGDGDPTGVVGNFTGDGDVSSPSKRRWSSAFPRYSDGYWGPAPVRKFPPDAFGLYDMEGNVSEWVEDCWHDNYVRAPKTSEAWVNPGCERRVVRGGSWGSDPDQVRSAFRLGASATTRSARVGFRVARDL